MIIEGRVKRILSGDDILILKNYNNCGIGIDELNLTQNNTNTLTLKVDHNIIKDLHDYCIFHPLNNVEVIEVNNQPLQDKQDKIKENDSVKIRFI